MVALAAVVTLVLGAPMLYFGILFATRDPVLNSLDRLQVPAWAAQSPEDRTITGSRWCIIDCRFRERTLESSGEPEETTAVYEEALRGAGWTRWEVEGCPQVEVDGEYSCWTRDEYTLDLWVRPPECAYDPLNLRPDLEDGTGDQAEPDGGGEGDGEGDGDGDGAPGEQECSGSFVEIKMQNRVSDERGLPGSGPAEPAGPPGEESADPSGEAPEPTGAASPAAAP